MAAVDFEITVSTEGTQEVSLESIRKLSNKVTSKWDKPSYYICNFCRKPFDTQEAVEDHLDQCRSREKDANEKEVYECPECKELFSTFSGLGEHMSKHQNKLIVLEGGGGLNRLSSGDYKCNICQKAVSTKGNLQKHQIIHLGIKPYKCNFCEKFFTLKGNRDKHELTHTDSRPHKCQICEKRFTLKGNLQQHILTHSDFKFFQCYLCNKEFTLKGNLDKHIKRHANGMTTPKPSSEKKSNNRKKKNDSQKLDLNESIRNTLKKGILGSFFINAKTFDKGGSMEEGKIDGTTLDMEVEECENAATNIPEPDNEVEYDEMAEGEEMNENYEEGVTIQEDQKDLESSQDIKSSEKMPEVDVQNL